MIQKFKFGLIQFNKIFIQSENQGIGHHYIKAYLNQKILPAQCGEDFFSLWLVRKPHKGLVCLESLVRYLICQAITSKKHGKIIQRKYPLFNPVIIFATRTVARTNDAIIADRFSAMKLKKGYEVLCFNCLKLAIYN